MHLELLHTEEELKSKLHVLQENVLKDLASAQGNILENQVKLFFCNLKNHRRDDVTIFLYIALIYAII